MWLFATECAHEHLAQVAHPAVVIKRARARRAADRQALHDAEDCVVGVVVDLPHVDLRADRAVGKSLADRLGHRAAGGLKRLGRLVFDLVESARGMQRQLRVEREAHAVRVEVVELRIADEDVFRVLQAGRAAVGHGAGHPVDALEDALPVEQGRGQDQIGLGLKVAKDRPLGEPGAQRDVRDLGLFDPVGQKTVQRDLRDQPDILFPLLLVRQVRSPPLFLSVTLTGTVYREKQGMSSP